MQGMVEVRRWLEDTGLPSGRCPEHVSGSWLEFSDAWDQVHDEVRLDCGDCDRNPGLSVCHTCCDEVIVTSTNTKTIMYNKQLLGAYYALGESEGGRKFYKKSFSERFVLHYTNYQWTILYLETVGEGIV